MGKSRTPTPVACEKCDRIINRGADMDRHLTTHLEDKEDRMHHCTYPGCTFQALQESNLRSHENTHTGERPHKCPVEGCDFRTGHPGSLTRHRRTQHGYLPKARPGSRPPAITQRATRRLRRSSPYPSSSALFSDDNAGKGGKGGSNNTSSACSTELISRHARADDIQLVSTVLPDHAPVASGSGLLTTFGAAVAEHPHELASDHDGNFDVAAQRLLDMTALDDLFSNFYAAFNDWLPVSVPGNSGPSLPFPLTQHTVYDAIVPTPSSLSSTQSIMHNFQPPTSYSSPVVSYTTNRVPMPAPSLSQSHEVQCSVVSSTAPAPTSWIPPLPEAQYAPSSYACDGCITTSTVSAAQPYFSQPDSLATLSMDVYPQTQHQFAYPRALVDIDQNDPKEGCFHTSPTTADHGDVSTRDAFGTQGPYGW